MKNVRRLLTYLLLTAIFATAAVTADVYADETEPDLLQEPLGNSFNDATRIDVNTVRSDSIQSGTESNHYVFTLTEPGYVSFDFDHGYVDTDGVMWYLSLYRSADLNEPLLTREYIGNSRLVVTSEGTGLGAGTYYLKISPHSALVWDPAVYRFKVNFTESDDHETELNDSATQANVIEPGEQYNGNIMEKSDEDYYVVTLTEPGYVNVTFSHEYIESNKVYWRVSLYEKSDLSEPLFTRKFSGNQLESKTAYGTGLPAGTYYIKIMPGLLKNWSDKPYHFTLNQKVSEYYETERNDGASTADQILLNASYRGNIMEASDKDYYRFTLKKDGDVSFTFSHDELKDDLHYWELLLYGISDLNDPLFTIRYAGNKIGEETSRYVKLPAGTYFVMIRPCVELEWSDKAYRFRVNTKLSVSITQKKIPTGGRAKINVSNNQGGKLSYSSNDTSVAVVDRKGNVTGVNPGTTKIKVTAAASSASKKKTGTVTVKVVGLGRTGKLTASNTSQGIRLKYKKVPLATRYLIYRNDMMIKEISGNSNVKFTDTSGLENGKKYTYRVVAASEGDIAKTNRSVVIYRLDRCRLGSVKSTRQGRLTIKWKTNPKASGYQIQYSNYAGFTNNRKVFNVEGSGKTKKTIKNLYSGNTYYVRVRSFKKVGNKKYYSAWSTTKSTTVR